MNRFCFLPDFSIHCPGDPQQARERKEKKEK